MRWWRCCAAAVRAARQPARNQPDQRGVGCLIKGGHEASIRQRAIAVASAPPQRQDARNQTGCDPRPACAGITTAVARVAGSTEGRMNQAAHRGPDSRLATTGMMIAPAIRCAAARVSLVEIAVSAAVAGTASERASSGSAVRR